LKSHPQKNRGYRKLFGDNVDNSEKSGKECRKMAQISHFLKMKKEKVIPIVIPKEGWG
jgi:hypothetical protein